MAEEFNTDENLILDLTTESNSSIMQNNESEQDNKIEEEDEPILNEETEEEKIKNAPVDKELTTSLNATYFKPYQKDTNVQFLGNTGIFEKKQDSYAPVRVADTYDVNELRGQRQTTFDKWGNGLTKAVGKVGTNVGGGLVGAVYGVGSALVNLEASKVWDNSVMHALDGANEWMDGKLPNYYTNYEREMSVWKKFGTANFWADQAFNGLSFVAGAALTELALTSATAFTGGVASAAQIAYTASLAGRAARLLKGFSKAGRVLDKAADATRITAAIKGAIRSDRFWDSAKLGRQLITGAGYESGVEARQSYEHMKETLTQSYLNQIEKKEGQARELTMDEKADIESKARSQANAVFAGNLILVGGSNMIMLGGLYGPGASLKTLYKNGMNKIGLGSRPITKTAEGTAKATYKSNRVGQALGLSEKNALKLGKASDRIQAVTLPAVYEGFVEEGGQSILSEAAYEYTLAKYGIKGKKQTADIFDAFNRGYIKTFKDPDGQTEVALGFILGAIGLPGGTFNNGSWTAAGARLQEVRNKESFQDIAADYYNKHGKDIMPTLKAYSTFMTEQQELAPLMDKYLADGNIAEYKNLQNDKFFAYVKAKEMTGQFDDIKEEADEIRNMSDAEFIEYFGYKESDFNNSAEVQARKNKMADSVIRRANKVRQAFKDVDGVLKLSDNSKWTDEKSSALREKMAHRLASMDLISEREESIINKLAKLTGGKVNESADMKNKGSAKSITYIDSNGKEKVFTIGDFSTETAKQYLKELTELSDKKDSELSVPPGFKDVSEYRTYLDAEIESTKQILGLSVSTGVNQRASFALDQREEDALIASLQKQLNDLIKTDPKAVLNQDEIIQMLKDLKHLRARREQFIKEFNIMRSNPDQALQDVYDKIERFVDDVESSTAKDNIDGDQGVKQLFEDYGTKAKFRVGETWYRFDSGGNLLEEGTENVVSSTILNNFGGRTENVLTDEQVKAKNLLQAIDELKQEKGKKVEQLAVEIAELENEVLELMIKMENLDTTVTLQEITETHTKLVDQIETGEELIKELQDEQKKVLNQIDYLTEIVNLHYNSKTGEFSVDIATQYKGENDLLILNALKEGIPIDLVDRQIRLSEIEARLFGINEALELLKVEDSQEGVEALRLEEISLREEFQKIQSYPEILTREERGAVAEIAEDIKQSIQKWSDLSNKNIQNITQKLTELQGHKDILERMIFDRIKTMKNKGLDDSSANTFDELYADAVNIIENYVSNIELKEKRMKETGEIPEDYVFIAPQLRNELTLITGTAEKNYNMSGMSLKNMTQDMLDLDMEGSEGLPTYQKFKRFRENNPDAFRNLESFFTNIDKVQKAFSESRLLRKHLKATNEEINSITSILNNNRAQREIGDVDQRLVDLNMLLNAVEFMDAAEEILAKVRTIEASVIAPKSNNRSSSSTNKPNDPPTPLSNYDEDSKGIEKLNPSLSKPDISDPGFMKTAGNQFTAIKNLKELSITDGSGNMVLDENQEPVMRDGLNPEEQKLWRSSRDQMIWFRTTSNYISFKDRRLMAVHSNNIPEDIKEDLKGMFFNNGKLEDTSHSDPNTSDIKLVLVDTKGKPIRVNSKGFAAKKGEKSFLAYTSMMSSDINTKKGKPRFTNRDEKSEQELLDIATDYQKERQKILNSSKPKLLFINGLSAGIPNTLAKINNVKQYNPIKGRVIGARGKKGTKDVVISIATAKIIDENGNETSEINLNGQRIKVPNAGMVYTVSTAGNIAPLHVRTLNNVESQNIINMLRMVQLNYEKLRQDPANKTKPNSELRAQAAKFKVGGKDLFAFSVLKDLIMYGQGTIEQLDDKGKRIDFYDTGKGYQMGETSISYQDILDNNTAALNEFLQNKYINVNSRSLRNKKGKTSATPFYAPFFKEVGTDKIELDDNIKYKWDNYEQFLLEARKDSRPPLQTNLPLMSGGYTTPQYKFRYLKIGIPGSSTNINRIHKGQSDAVAPEGIVYTALQKATIPIYQDMLNNAKEGKPVEIEDENTGASRLITKNYAINLDGSEFDLYAGLPINEMTSDNEYIDLLLEYLEEYKSAARANSFINFATNKFNKADTLNEEYIVDGQTEEEIEINAENAEEALEEQQKNREIVIQKAEDSIAEPTQSLLDIPTLDDPDNTISDILTDEVSEESDAKLDQIKKDREDNTETNLFDDEDEINMISTQVDNTDISIDNVPGVTNEEIENAKRMIPWNEFKFIQGYIQGNTPNIIGQVKGYGKTLISELAVGGVTYHENFHQVSKFILSQDTRDDMYNEVRKQKGNFKDYKGVMVSFSKASNKQAEEYLAEEFRKWILSDRQYKKDTYSNTGFFAKLFARLKNFFRGIFGLDQKLQPSTEMATVAAIFNKINAGSFAKSKPVTTVIDEVANMAILKEKGESTTSRFSTDMMSTFTKHFGVALFDDPNSSLSLSDLDILTDPNRSSEYSKKLAKTYRKAANLMYKELGDKAILYSRLEKEEKNANKKKKYKISKIQALRAMTYLDGNNVKDTRINNLTSLQEVHRQFLVSLGLDTSLKIEREENLKDGKSDPFNILESMEFSAAGNAHPYIKLLLGTLPDASKNNVTGTTGIIDSNYSMNFIQDRLSGIVSSEKQLKELAKLSVKHPWLKTLIKRLGTFTENSSFNQMKLSNLFTQQMSKTKNTFDSYLLDKEGNLYSVDPNSNQLKNIIITPWKNNLKNSTAQDSQGNLLVKIEEGELKINLDYRPDLGTIKNQSLRKINQDASIRNLVLNNPDTALRLFESFGFEFSNRKDLLTSNKTIDGQKISDIIKDSASWLLSKLPQGNLGADLFSRETIDAQNKLGNLLKAELLFNDKVVELKHFNAEGKPVYGITLNNYLSLIANKLNSKDVVNHFKNNLYTANSATLKEMASNPDAKINIHVIEGLKILNAGDQGLHTSNLTYEDRSALYINSVLNNVIPVLRTADAKTEYGVKLPIEMFSDPLDAKSTFLGYILDELNTAVAFNTKSLGKDIKDYNQKGGELRIFDHILNAYLKPTEKADLNQVLQGFISPEEFISKYENSLTNAVLEYINNQAKKNKQLMIDNKIVTKGKGLMYRNLGLDRQTVSKVLRMRLGDSVQIGKEITSNQLDAIAKAFTLKTFIGNVEQLKLFFGDIAQYKDLYKRTKLASGTKKFPRIDSIMNNWLNNNEVEISEDIKEGYGEHNKNYNGKANIMVFNDPVSESVYWSEYYDYLGEDISNLYRNIEEADANAFANIHFYRELMIRISDWTGKQENLFKKAMLGQELTKEELTSFPTLKPQGFGPAISDMQQMVGLKLSLTPIFPQMTSINGKDTKLKGLLKNMYESGTDMVMHPTAAKIGSRVDSATGSAPSFYNENGEINSIDPDLHTTIDLSYFGIQVDINKDVKGKVTLGTQARTHILANLYEGGIPVDFSGSTVDWNNFSEKEKKEASKIHKNSQDYLDTINEFTRRSRENLLKKFNLEKVIDSQTGEESYKLKNGDMSKFAEVIKKEISDRKYPENVAAGIESLLNEKDGNKRVFDLIVNKNRIENLLFSLIGNSTITQKLKGESSVQVSSLGSETTVRVIKQGRLQSSGATGLKFYSKINPTDLNSETRGMEVYLPHYFKELLGEDIEIRQDGIYNSKGQLIGDSNLLDLIGFRIPTDGLHSIDFMKVKGFLPSTSGAQIMVPSELVIKAGSDFDIDKLTIYMPSYTVKNGKIIKREFISLNNKTGTLETLEEAKVYHDALYGPFITFWDKLNKDLINASAEEAGSTETAVNNLLMAIFRDNPNIAGDQLLDYSDSEIEVLFSTFRKLASNPTKDRADRIEDVIEEFNKLKKKANKIPSVQEFLKVNKGKKDVELNHIGAVQNRMMDIQKNILSTPRSYDQLLNPIGTRIISSIREELNIAPREVTYADLISYPHIFNITKDFQSGKNGLGIAAVNATHIVKSQQAGLYLNDQTTVINLEGFGIEQGSIIRLDRIYDVNEENRITDIASELLNVFADASEDPIVADLNLVPEVGNSLMFLLRAGVPIKQAVFFINQPIIKEYLRDLNVNKSKLNVAKGQILSKKDIEARILTKYKPSVVKPVKEFNSEELKVMSGKSLKQLKDENLLSDQTQILKDFINYDKIGADLTAITLATSFDTKLPKSRNHAKMILKNYDDVLLMDKFKNVDQLIKRTHLNEFNQTMTAASKQFNSMFLTERAGARAVGQLDRIFEIFSDKSLPMSEANKLAVMSEAENNLITAALLAHSFEDISGSYVQRLGDKTEELFLGDNTVAKRIAQLQKENPSNPFLQSLLPSIQKVRTGALRETDNIKVYTRILNNYEANLLRDSFLELSEADQNMLIEHAILQSGMSLNNMSYLHLLPTEKFTAKAVKIINKLTPSNTEVNNFFDNFFRNSWHDPRIVPRVPRSKYSITEKDGIVVGGYKKGISNTSSLGLFPYVSVVEDALGKTEAEELRKKGLSVPKSVFLYERVDVPGSNFYSYEPVEKLGNGFNLKEFPVGNNEKSILEKNNFTYRQSKDVHSKSIVSAIPATISQFELKQLRQGNVQTISVPENQFQSGKTYRLPDSTLITLKLEDQVNYKSLDTAEKLDNFARKEGYDNWERLLPKIKSGKNKIPSSWLDKSKNMSLNMFTVTSVNSKNSDINESDYNKAVSIVADNPEDYGNKEGQEIVTEYLENEIQNKIDAGIRTFKTKLLPGTGNIAIKILMQQQSNLSNLNQDLFLEVGVPGNNYIDKMSSEDKMDHLNILRALRRRKNNVKITGTRSLSDTKMSIGINKAEVLEQLEENKKTTCK